MDAAPRAEREHGGANSHDVVAEVEAVDVGEDIRHRVSIRGEAPPDECLQVGFSGDHVLHRLTGRRVLFPLLGRHRVHRPAHCRDDRLRLVRRLHLEHRTAEKRHHVDDDDRSDQLGMIDGDLHRERATEAVADDDGMIEMLLADVLSEVAANGRHQWFGNRRLADKT